MCDLFEIDRNTIVGFIHGFQGEVKILESPFAKRCADLSILNRKLRLDFHITAQEAIQNFSNDFLDEFYVTNNVGQRFVVPVNNAVLNTSTDISPSTSSAKGWITMSRMFDERWNENASYYYRFIIPIKDVFWLHNIRTTLCCYGGTSFLGRIIISFPEGDVEVYPFKDQSGIFMTIESDMQCTYEVMQKYLYSVSLSLGMVSSFAPFDYIYFMASESFRLSDNVIGGFAEMRPSIKVQDPFFTTNIYAVRDALKRHDAEYALKQTYKGKSVENCDVDWFQMCEFNNLVNLLYGNDDLARAALTLLDASSMALDYKGAMYAVALETICSVFEKKDVCFMDSKDWISKVKTPLVDLIDKLEASGVVTIAHSENMKNKLNGLNTISNKDKLSIPFSDRNYTLSKYEREVINNRNRFLHGHILGHSFQESYDELLYACYELQKLCAILLFRESGFTGPLLNNAVTNGLRKAIKNQEPVFV